LPVKQINIINLNWFHILKHNVALRGNQGFHCTFKHLLISKL
jgi:hypothetical protein